MSMPEVMVGAFLEYKIRTVQNKMVAKDKFDTNYFLQTDSPVQHAEFSVKLPQGRKLNQKVLNLVFAKQTASLSPIVVENSDHSIYSWKFDNIEQMIPEPQMPPLSEVTPVILLSTFESWKQVYDWWWPLAKDKIQVNEAMKAKIGELVNATMTEREKAEVLHNFCIRNIRYVGVEYGQAGYEPHPAPEIFSNKYGDCKDQSILLISMLEAVGIKAHPVLIGTREVPKLQDDFPSMLFNHCIVVAEIGGEFIFLDPTGETVLFGDLPAGDQARDVLVFFDNEAKIMKTPKYPADHNQVIKKTTLNFINPQEIKGQREITTQGIFDQGQRAWLRYTMPALIEETLRQKIQEVIPKGRLIDYKIENLDEMKKSITLFYSFSGSDFLIKAGDKMWVVPQLGGIDLDAVSRNERNFGIDLSLPQTYLTTIEINLPQEYRVKSLPKPVESDNKWFSYKHGYQEK
ncbi:MAG: transglutaminase domain-containing protein, partial [Candidatus Omnitrophica bacterium]|nr:transglutaminase domain-containing protein [Candidatus Omnitrophota bacterium]